MCDFTVETNRYRQVILFQKCNNRSWKQIKRVMIGTRKQISKFWNSTNVVVFWFPFSNEDERW